MYMGKQLLLMTAENIERGNIEFSSILANGILYNIMLSTNYGYKPVLYEDGSCQFLCNNEKGWEIDPSTIWFQVAEEIEVDEEILRLFVSWCNAQTDELVIALKLREMYEQHHNLTQVSFYPKKEEQLLRTPSQLISLLCENVNKSGSFKLKETLSHLHLAEVLAIKEQLRIIANEIDELYQTKTKEFENQTKK